MGLLFEIWIVDASILWPHWYARCWVFVFFFGRGWGSGGGGGGVVACLYVACPHLIVVGVCCGSLWLVVCITSLVPVAWSLCWVVGGWVGGVCDKL